MGPVLKPTPREYGMLLRAFAEMEPAQRRANIDECLAQFEQLVPKQSVVSHQGECYEVVRVKWHGHVEDITAFAVEVKHLRSGKIATLDLVDVLRPAQPQTPVIVQFI